MNELEYCTPNKNIDVMSLLIKNALDNVRSAKVRKEHECMSLAAHRECYGSIRIKMARQAGHTTLAAMLLYSLDDALVFVKSATDRDNILNIIASFKYIDIETRQKMAFRVHAYCMSEIRQIEPVDSRTVVVIDSAWAIDRSIRDVILGSFNDTELIVELQ